MTAAVDIVRQFRYLRVLVIGDALLDTYLEGTAARLCSEGPVPVVRKTAEHRCPGGAANTAANLRALGAEVIFLGIVGHDGAGAALHQVLQRLDVDDGWLVQDEGAPTSHKMRVLADGQYVVRFDDEKVSEWSPESQHELVRRLDAAFARCDLVVVSDYNYGVVTDTLVARLTELRRARPCPLLVDSKHLDRFRTAEATVLTPNLLEARLLSGDASHAPAGTCESETLRAIGHALLARVPAEYVAITLAADGVFLMRRDGERMRLPAHPVPHAYDVGAGDSFAAAMALALGAGAAMTDAAQIGLDAASLAVTRRFTTVVTAQELLQRVSLREHAAGPAPDTLRAVEHLAVRLAEVQRAGKSVVFTNGVFDILHAGHVQFLRQAKLLGDVLVVGVNSDGSARRLKGEGRPINGERDRLALVSALDAVDHAVIFDEDTPESLIRALRPQFHVKGGDYADVALPEAEAVREVGGQVVILPLAGSLSTSAVIARISSLATTSHEASMAGGIGAQA